MSVPAGFLNIALTANPTAASPTWTRVDNLAGVMIESIEIERGRPTEWDKTSPGVVTIRGVDTSGALDPTNQTSPLWPFLVPVKQAAVCVKNPHTGNWNYLFRGHIAYVNSDPDTSENWQEFEIQLVDMLDILNDAEVVPDFAGNRVPTESQGDTWYDGQPIADRILAVLADASTAFMRRVWPPTMIQLASGNISVQGTVYSRGTALLRVIDEACDAEFPDAANRFATTDGQFAFRGRFYRFNPLLYIPGDGVRHEGARMLHWFCGDQKAFDDGLESGSIAVASEAKIRVDKADLVNAALVTAKGVTDKTLAGGRMFSSDSASVATYGVRTGGRSMEGLIIDGHNGDHLGPDNEAATYADVIVQNYKDPCVHVEEMTFKSPVNDGTGKYANVWKILTEIELSDLVTYYDTHAGGGGFTLDSVLDHDHYVESIKYSLKALSGDTALVDLTLGLTSRQHYRYASPYWNFDPHASGPELTAPFSAIGTGSDFSFYSFATPGPSGPITAYAWDFGDGGTDTVAFPFHTYASPGDYWVTLTVTGTGADGTATTGQSVSAGLIDGVASQIAGAWIRALPSAVQTATAAVQNTASKTQTAKANIEPAPKKQTAKVRVQKTVTKTQTAKVRARKTVTKAQMAKAHIA